MVETCVLFMFQGRSQVFWKGGAQLKGEGSGGSIRPPAGPGQSPDREPRKLWGFSILQTV